MHLVNLVRGQTERDPNPGGSLDGKQTLGLIDFGAIQKDPATPDEQRILGEILFRTAQELFKKDRARSNPISSDLTTLVEIEEENGGVRSGYARTVRSAMLKLGGLIKIVGSDKELLQRVMLSAAHEISVPILEGVLVAAKQEEIKVPRGVGIALRTSAGRQYETGCLAYYLSSSDLRLELDCKSKCLVRLCHHY